MQILFSTNRPIEKKPFRRAQENDGGSTSQVDKRPIRLLQGNRMFVPENTTLPSIPATAQSSRSGASVPGTTAISMGRFEQNLLMMHSAPTGRHHDYSEVIDTNPPSPSRGDARSAGGSTIGGFCETPGDGANLPRAVKASGAPCRKLPLSCGRMQARRLPAGGARISGRMGG